MAWVYYSTGKDQEAKSVVEIDEHSYHTIEEIFIALCKTLIKKQIIKKDELLENL